MKNSGSGSRRAPRSLIRVIAAPLIATAILVILGAGPAMAADDASTASDTAAYQGLVAGILADHSLTIEIIVVLVGAALMLAYGHHRRSVNRRHSAHGRTRRSPAHDRASSVARMAAYPAAGDRTPGPGRPAAVGDSWLSAPPRAAAGQPLHADDYPSWPGRPGPYALHPDHPSWPGRPDPRWAATEAALEADGYPGWPDSGPPPWRDAVPSADNSGPVWPGGGGPAARRQPQPTAHRPPPAAGQRALSAPVRTDFGSWTDAAPRADIMPRQGPMRQGPMRQEPMRQEPMRQERQAGVVDRVRPGADWVQPERVQVWDAGSVELATWIISEANQQAADIRHEARDQMATSLADARQEAAELVRKASEQATATVTAAEQEAAEIRATITKLSADLGGMAAQVTQNLAGFATSGTKPLTTPAVQSVTAPSAAQPIATPAHEPVTGLQARPAARPTTQPRTKPETRPKSRPAGQPGTRPVGRPGTRSAPKPGTRSAGRAKGKPRQLRAIRVAAVVTAALFLFAVGTGATEVALHGFSFFVFRESGAGETGPSAPTDQQLLSQQAAAAKAAAQKAHTPGRHSAKSTPGAEPTSG
jgi:hypothetical protein